LSATVAGGYLLLSRSAKKKQIKASKSWEEEAKSGRIVRDEKIESFLSKHQHSLNAERVKHIISLDVCGLANEIRTKEVTAVEALLAYAVRAGTIGKDLCLIGDTDFEDALKTAQALDDAIHKNKHNDLPPLAGVPVSIKDQIDVRGMLNTAGYTSRCKNIATEDSDIVKVLRRNGAIPFVTSNVPQGLATIEAISKMWGAAQNPWNRMKTTGGSSGGEAGLVAARCSPFGIGSDIAGSIRVPANYCGTYGFKPTAARISQKGTFSNFKGFTPVCYSFGPICKTMDDTVLISKCLLGSFNEDTNVINKPFDEGAYNNFGSNKLIKIGYIYETEFCETAPVIKDAISEVIKKLESQSYDVVPFDFPKLLEMVDIGLKLYFNSEGFESIMETLHGEQPEKYYEEILHFRSISNIHLTAMKKQAELIGEVRNAHIMGLCEKMTRLEYLDSSRKLLELKAEFLKYWREHKFDSIICPVLPFPAADLHTGKDAIKFVQFTFLFNLMDMPAGHVPLKLVDNIDYESKYKDSLTTFIQKSLKSSLHLPVGIQVATLPQQDEICLKSMRIINDINLFDINYSQKVFDSLGQPHMKSEEPVITEEK